jgi:carboxymethylenebutenolidase
MGMMTDIATFDGAEQFPAYCVAPEDAPKAAIIVVQEIFGLTAGIRRKADDWAALGYLAIAPEMFWRFAPGLDLDPDIPEQLDQAMALRSRFDFNDAVADIEAAIRHARTVIGARNKVGVVGFCWGGSVAYLAATRTYVDASVGYYGRQIADHLNEAHAIARPLLLYFGEDDPSIPADMRASVRATLGANERVTIRDYPGAGHGFAATFGKRRHDHAAQQADAHTRDFFAQHLL